MRLPADRADRSSADISCRNAGQYNRAYCLHEGALMAFIQRIQPTGDDRCREHGLDGCHVIDCITTEPVTAEDGSVIHPAGTVVWHSHMDAAICPDHRLNPD